MLRDHESGARLRGILLMVAAVSLFSCLDAAAKYASREIPVLEVVFFRYAFHMLLAAAVLNPWSSPDAWRVRRPGLQILRALTLLVVTCCNFLALRWMQLAETVTIAFLAPLLIAGLSVLFLKETIGIRRLAAILVGFSGILVVTRPGLAAVHPAVFLSLGSVLFAAFYNMLTRHLAGSETPGSMLLFTAGIPALVLLPVLPFVWTTPTEPVLWILLPLIGAIGAVSHYLLIIAHRFAPASMLAPFGYAQILSMVALGYVVFGDVPTLWTLSGAAIVIASGLYLLHRERVRARVAPEAPTPGIS